MVLVVSSAVQSGKKPKIDWPSSTGLKINMACTDRNIKYTTCNVGQSETQVKAGLAVAASHVSFMVESA